MPGPTAPAAAAIFKTYALNALLVPLLDDEVPARWAEPSLALDCDGARVTVDGATLDIDAPVPTGPFVVRWQMQNCELPGSAMALSGEVELRVVQMGGEYQAQVQPIALQIASASGVQTLTEPFAARMPAGATPWPESTRP